MASKENDLRDSDSPIAPGNPDADFIKKQGYKTVYAEMMARIKFAEEEWAAERKEGLHPESKKLDGADDDDLCVDKFTFSRGMIKAAIGAAEEFFANDRGFEAKIKKHHYGDDEIQKIIRNAAVVSVGMGIILAPHLAPEGSDPVEALRLGRIRGQQEVDRIDPNKLAALDGGTCVRNDAKCEEELFMKIGEGGKVSDADRKLLEAFLKKNGYARVVVSPKELHFGGVDSMSFSTSIKRAQEKALSWLTMLGAEMVPAPKKSPKNGHEQHGPQPVVHSPPPPAS